MRRLWIGRMVVNLKGLILTITTIGLAACNGMPQKNSAVVQYETPQEVISKKGLNQADGRAKEYIYVWDRKQNQPSQAMYPRASLMQHCHQKGGKLSLLYKSQYSLIRDVAQKKRLSQDRTVAQGVGAYQCVFKHSTQWIVSIEPLSERQIEKKSSKRGVLLLTKLMSAQEARQFYRVAATSSTAKTTTTKSVTKVMDKKEADKKALEKKETKTKTAESSSTTPEIVSVANQQMRLYVSARRDINSGKNLNNACNNAQRAYNYGKQQGTEGTRVYTESGMLVARCLTSVSSYSSRIPNARGQAKRVLNGLATQYNHAGAKNMLRQLN